MGPGPRPGLRTPLGKVFPDVVCHYCKGKGHFYRGCNKYALDYHNGKVKWPDSNNAKLASIQDMYAGWQAAPSNMPEWGSYGYPAGAGSMPPYSPWEYGSVGGQPSGFSEAGQRALPAPSISEKEPENFQGESN